MKKIVILDTVDGSTCTGRRDVFNAIAESDIALAATYSGQYYVMKHRDGDLYGKCIDSKDLENIIEDKCAKQIDLNIPDAAQLREICEPIRKAKLEKELSSIVEIINCKIQERAKDGHSFFRRNCRVVDCELNIALEDCQFVQFSDISEVYTNKGYTVDQFPSGSWMISWRK